MHPREGFAVRLLRVVRAEFGCGRTAAARLGCNGGEETLRNDHDKKDANGGERDADQAASELKHCPDCDGDIVPCGVDCTFEGEEGVEADDGGDTTTANVKHAREEGIGNVQSTDAEHEADSKLAMPLHVQSLYVSQRKH